MAHQERVTEMVTQVVPGVFYGLAVIAGVGRTFVRWRQYRRLSLDDCFVIFALICLTSGTIVLYLSFPTIYLVQTFLLNPFDIIPPANFLQEVDWYQKGAYVFLSLGFATIFSIKASFLCFFKQLINRENGIRVYWMLVVIATTVSFPICVASEFIACPMFGIEALSCSIPKAYAVSYVSISLDILTDIMIMAIPVWLLYNVSFKIRQKFGLLLFLCLSLVMVIMAAVRMSGIRANEGTTEDIVWVILWHQVESCIAVIMVCFVAFRSAVINQRPRATREWWRMPRISLNFWTPYKRREQHSSAEGLPEIPAATLTGLKTFIDKTPYTKGDDMEKAIADH